MRLVQRPASLNCRVHYPSVIWGDVARFQGGEPKSSIRRVSSAFYGPELEYGVGPVDLSKYGVGPVKMMKCGTRPGPSSTKSRCVIIR